jgi:uncharacterized membrane protein
MEVRNTESARYGKLASAKPTADASFITATRPTSRERVVIVGCGFTPPGMPEREWTAPGGIAIVSHVVLSISSKGHMRGEPLREALLDAGIVRLRPVKITVGATELGLIPLAIHGGPHWEPLCYAQIGGLTIATFVTLLLAPVIYSIFVLDLKLIKGECSAEAERMPAAELTTAALHYSH